MSNIYLIEKLTDKQYGNFGYEFLNHPKSKSEKPEQLQKTASIWDNYFLGVA